MSWVRISARVWFLPCVTIFLQGSTKQKNEETLSPETDSLLAALQVKAAAFSDDSWNTHWLAKGPQILIEGWKEAYPNIPLSRVAQVCVVDFLAPFLTEAARPTDQGIADDLDRLTLDCNGSKTGETPSPSKTDTGEPSGGEQESVLSGLEKLEISDGGEPEHSASGHTKLEAQVSDGDIAVLWGDHYNGYYWYYYQCYQQEKLAPELVGEEVKVSWNSYPHDACSS